MKSVILTIGSVLILLVGAVWLHAKPSPNPTPIGINPPIVGTLTAAPAAVPVGSPTAVNFTIGINDPALISGSVNLLRLHSGAQSEIVGKMYDDGTHGDKTAGDHTYTLQVVLNEPSIGQIQFQVSEAFRGLLQRVLSSPITIPVWQYYPGNASSAVSFAYPTFPNVPYSIDVLPNSIIAYDVMPAPNTTPEPVFSIVVRTNDDKLSLLDWFSQNVDSSGLLLNSGEYTFSSMPDGTQVLLATGSPPIDWTGGPTDAAYLMSPDGTEYALFEVSNDSPLAGYGVSSLTFADMVHLIVESVRFR